MPSKLRGSDNLDSGKVTGKTKKFYNVTASRALGVPWVNTYDYEVWVYVQTGSSSAQTCVATLDGEQINGSSFSSTGNNTVGMFPVPPGASITVTNTGTSPVLAAWKEYR